MLVAAAVFVTIAWLAREFQGMRERAQLERTLHEMRLSQQTVRDGVRRLAEDFFVMQHLLAERSVVQDADMLRGRSRLIEQPRRKAQEKHAIMQHLGTKTPPLMVEDADGKVH